MLKKQFLNLKINNTKIKIRITWVVCVDNFQGQMESPDLDTSVDCVEEIVEHEVCEGLQLVMFKNL